MQVESAGGHVPLKCVQGLCGQPQGILSSEARQDRKAGITIWAALSRGWIYLPDQYFPGTGIATAAKRNGCEPSWLLKIGWMIVRASQIFLNRIREINSETNDRVDESPEFFSMKTRLAKPSFEKLAKTQKLEWAMSLNEQARRAFASAQPRKPI
jgi:hypothetical protein